MPCDRFGFSMARTLFIPAHRLALEVTVMDVEHAVTSCSQCELTLSHFPVNAVINHIIQVSKLSKI